MSDTQNDVKKFQVSVFIQNLIKLVPTEFIVLWGIIVGLIPTTAPALASWIVLGAITLLIPFYLIFSMKVKDVGQIILTTLAFPLWSMMIGGAPAMSLTWFEPWMVSVGIAIFTFIPPMFYGKRVNPEEIPGSVPTTATRTPKSWREVV